ncbi:UNVERIFIED_CONTAM: hypothetical protein B566_EDAN018066 [Ephemera danica]|nr:hypothetical protein B566_EDAN018066 [Ephemera danica]
MFMQDSPGIVAIQLEQQHSICYHKCSSTHRKSSRKSPPHSWQWTCKYSQVSMSKIYSDSRQMKCSRVEQDLVSDVNATLPERPVRASLATRLPADTRSSRNSCCQSFLGFDASGGSGLTQLFNPGRGQRFTNTMAWHRGKYWIIALYCIVKECTAYPVDWSNAGGGGGGGEEIWGPALASVALLGACAVLALLGCVCCRQAKSPPFEEFTDTASNHSLSTAGFVNPLAAVAPTPAATSVCTEFTIFPPPGATVAASNPLEPPAVRFEPLPDIRPRGASIVTAVEVEPVPPATPLRPAAFSSGAPAPCELLGERSSTPKLYDKRFFLTLCFVIHVYHLLHVVLNMLIFVKKKSLAEEKHYNSTCLLFK